MDIPEKKTEETLADVRHRILETLSPRYGVGEADAMARLVMTHLKGWDFPTLLANENREASDYVKGRADEIIEQLLRDVPIQYALGETTFYGLKLKVGPGVLIPRPETEELVEWIVKDNQQPDLDVIDLCTGSGAIAAALARNLRFARVEAVDVSPEAVEVARGNFVDLKLKVEVREADVFTLELPSEAFDIIVSNPPYVDLSEKAGMEPNVVDHEPHLALFVPDDDPLVFYRRIGTIALDALRPGGRLYFEINPRHASDLRRLLEEMGYGDTEIMKDVHGRDRALKAVKKG